MIKLIAQENDFYGKNGRKCLFDNAEKRASKSEIYCFINVYIFFHAESNENPTNGIRKY